MDGIPTKGDPRSHAGCVIAVHLFGGMGLVDGGAPCFIHTGTFLLDGLIFSIGRTLCHGSDYPPFGYTGMLSTTGTYHVS